MSDEQEAANSGRTDWGWIFGCMPDPLGPARSFYPPHVFEYFLEQAKWEQTKREAVATGQFVDDVASQVVV